MKQYLIAFCCDVKLLTLYDLIPLSDRCPGGPSTRSWKAQKRLRLTDAFLIFSRGKILNGWLWNIAFQTRQLMTGLEYFHQQISGRNVFSSHSNWFSLYINWYRSVYYFLSSASICLPETPRTYPPLLCTAPIKVQAMLPWIYSIICFSVFKWEKGLLNPILFFTVILQYQYANYMNSEYANTGNGSLRLQLIKQRSDFSFALFSGGLLTVSS